MINCRVLDVKRYYTNITNITSFCDKLGKERGKMYCQWDDSKKVCGGIPIPDMAFSQFCGILLTAFVYFTIYCVYKQWYTSKEPWVNIPLIGPGFACGAVWAFAQIGWFYANNNLSMAIAFPIVATAPGLIGTAWGILM